MVVGMPTLDGSYHFSRRSHKQNPFKPTDAVTVPLSYSHWCLPLFSRTASVAIRSPEKVQPHCSATTALTFCDWLLPRDSLSEESKTPPAHLYSEDPKMRTLPKEYLAQIRAHVLVP